ncbi:hypothetical protein DES53_11296 [Roseimicrobium gellanilyticum]|uniref:Uncharacterized protein n=1 Tax=Roseimicrobium gellanilyticum TaxID=748857 RepID=A0A366H917_9BACT|nr:hypothetical protein [Roseimicrobium gellanilyticum]RBP38098.1 hypothetical protein DES53_11296 [Roseimicrobium gellanilyticum]
MLRALGTAVPDDGTDLPKEERIKNARATFCALYRPLIVVVGSGTTGMQPDWVEDFAQWMLVQLLYHDKKQDELMRKVVTDFCPCDEQGNRRRFAPYLSGYISNKARDFVKRRLEDAHRNLPLDAPFAPDKSLTLLDVTPWDDPREDTERKEVLRLRLCAVIIRRATGAPGTLKGGKEKQAQQNHNGLRVDMRLLHARSINTSSEELASEMRSTPNSIDVQRAKARRWLEADLREISEEEARPLWKNWLCRRAIQYLLGQGQLIEADITALRNRLDARFLDRRLKARQLIEETMGIIQAAWMDHPFEAALSPDFGCFSAPATP